MTRLLTVLLTFTVAFCLISCAGSTMTLPLTGMLSGHFVGQFLNDDSSIVLGGFEIDVLTSGQMSGEGMLFGQRVVINGGSDSEGSLSGNLTSQTSTHSGTLSGVRSPEGYAGTFTMETDAVDDYFGRWNLIAEN